MILFNSLFTELQPKVRGWLLASADGKTTGLVPHNYIKILGKRRGRKYTQQQQQESSADESRLASVVPPPVMQPSASMSSQNPSSSQLNLAAFDKAYPGDADKLDFSLPGASRPEEEQQPQPQLEGADGWSNWTAEAGRNGMSGTGGAAGDGLETIPGSNSDTESQSLGNLEDSFSNHGTDET